MPPVPKITSRADYEVLRLFVGGKSEIEIADATGLTQKAITRVINDMCAGDEVVAGQMVTAYEHRARAVAAAQGRPGVPGVPRTTTVPPPGTLRPPAQPAAPAGPDTLTQLLHAAAASPTRRVQALGEKLRALAAEVREALAKEEQAAAAQRRVDELAAELKKAQEELRAATGRPARPPASGAAVPAAGPEVPAKTVRAWARQNKVDVPALGRIPRDVMDAYLKANPGQATASTDPDTE
ncbi:histone-like nucleoid-structuring protein Lsr2 [Micromonospora sp. NPDC048930]|uniref:Lsr2 family DNA-binding protein n=1 Tax=Micromonospora sp. NPDC048930 TaxID=3364261 RepID=UPI0037139DB7